MMLNLTSIIIVSQQHFSSLDQL